MGQRLQRFEALVAAFEALPTIGKKGAQRLAFHLLINDPMAALRLAHAIEEALAEVGRCRMCGGLSEDELCPICSDPNRDPSLLCLVQEPQEILLIEESGEYDGYYFLLERPVPEVVQPLRQRIKELGVQEIIFALTPSIANEGIMLHLEEQLRDLGVRMSQIAHGVPTGVALERLDRLTIAKAIRRRQEREEG
ncbi:MAG: recombination protein RecR [Nitratiruptor sp.]|nr:recombination protein RecR [Nitratiruptor sp.]NPA83972.1 recombination protein RecR [Campylobacterota bacterium]